MNSQGRTNHRRTIARLITLPLAATFSIALTPVAIRAQEPSIVSTVIDSRGNANDRVSGGAVAPVVHPSRVLVRFRTGARADFLAASPSEHSFPADPNLHLVENPAGVSVAEAVRQYRANPNVEYVEPDYVVHTDATPSDPLWSQQWDMVKIAAPTAWASQTDSHDIVVAIIDSGIDFTHPDLKANLWTAGDGSHGFTCIKGKCTKGGADDLGHGTHVAGTIGAAANNGIGIAGLNWRIQLLSVKFLASDGSGYVSDAVLAFDQVTALKQQGVNIRVTNNSWGGPGYSQALKDAIARAEAADIVHVCAAGNNSVNIDGLPTYPAAYDNRGIVAVLATDPNDVAAAFTNYGLATVDIAAPGVSTLSTVPTGSCALCDATGYKLLSGTSMATPHVSGVLAALFHQNPALTGYQARDVVLDPRSDDALKDARARTTTTGGRLNFAKAVGNSLLRSPVLNTFPTLAVGPNVFASPGSQVNLTAAVADADNDPLRVSWSHSPTLWTEWLFGWMINSVFPDLSGSSASFTAPSLSRTLTVGYGASVADGRGGSAQGFNYVTVAPSAGAGSAPGGTLTVSSTDAAPGSTITVNFATSDAQGGPVAWAMSLGMTYAYTGLCCLTSSSTSFTLNEPGVYRIGAQAVDGQLNLSARQTAVVRIGGATGEPPIARATLDKPSGVAPFTVTIDASASTDADGTIRNYYFDCGDGALNRSRSSKTTCTLSSPGVYGFRILVADDSGNVDAITTYAVATPPGQ